MTDRQTVLAIDDVPANLKLLGHILGQEYRFLCTTRGAEGLEIAAAQRPDIILLDVMMPGLDGHEVCRQLKGDPRTRDIPVVFITSLKEETDETRGLEIGAIDYVTKPFCPAIVRARVHNHLELKKYRDLLEALSMTDGLTGIPNRRHFDQYLEREWSAALRQGTSLAVILIDIDFFKLYNDHYGHLQGDECLRRVARALAGGARRPSDVVARYGGEEFAGLLPGTPLDEAVLVAERMLRAVTDLAIPHETSRAAPFVTLSLGVGSAEPRRGMTPADLVARADEKLYEAKRKGRNRVEG